MPSSCCPSPSSSSSPVRGSCPFCRLCNKWLHSCPSRYQKLNRLASFAFLCIKWPEQCVRVAACSIFTVKWNTCQGSNFSAIYSAQTVPPCPSASFPLQHERRVWRLSLSALVNFAHLKRGTSRWLYQTDPWCLPLFPLLPPLLTLESCTCVCVCVERPHFQFGAAVSGFDCSFSHPLCLPPLSRSSSFILLLHELVGGLTIRSRVDSTISPEPDAARNSCCCCYCSCCC